ncbi:ribonuclease HI family protein [Humibacter albus]|uniref:ribonuclease HI family protein n=1 Tax=Humibacter albus TaxID=427754 RepID=UPI0003B79EFB|nr:ribonuclease HI family protein [Humibacter albus]
MTIVAAADGSALGNPGPAGWAWYVDDGTWAAGGWPHGTNNQGELMAVIDLLESTAGENDDLLVLCDSQYVINAVTKWMPGWKRKGWRKADGSPVQNLQLLQRLDAALSGRDYAFEWVRGHAGHELNEAADTRARAVATAYQNGTPVDAGPGWRADSSWGPAAALDGSPDSPSPTTLGPTTLGPASLGPASGPDEASGPAEPTLFDVDDESDEQTVIRQERALLDPRVREDVAELSALLHPDFAEIGRSGRTWGKDDVALSPGSGEGVILERLSLDRVGPDALLHVFRAEDARGTTLRSSLWVRTGGRWRLRFHQGTPCD